MCHNVVCSTPSRRRETNAMALKPKTDSGFLPSPGDERCCSHTLSPKWTVTDTAVIPAASSAQSVVCHPSTRVVFTLHVRTKRYTRYTYTLI